MLKKRIFPTMASPVFSATLVACLVFLTGCQTIKLPDWRANEWLADSDAAQKRAADRQSGTIYYFADTPPHRPDPMFKALRDAVEESPFAPYVRCVIVKDHAPDRQFVAQFGVDRAPAVILLHPDGTYHAHVGFARSGELENFIASANPPGDTPTWNPLINRDPEYNWRNDVDAARSLAADSNRKTLIVYYRPWSNDLAAIDRRLMRPEVFRRFKDMVHVRTGSIWSVSQTADTPFGTLTLPAMIIESPDGTYRVLETPRDYAAIIHFADNSDQTDDTSASQDTQPPTALGSN